MFNNLSLDLVVPALLVAIGSYSYLSDAVERWKYSWKDFSFGTFLERNTWKAIVIYGLYLFFTRLMALYETTELIPYTSFAPNWVYWNETRMEPVQWSYVGSWCDWLLTKTLIIFNAYRTWAYGNPPHLRLEAMIPGSDFVTATPPKCQLHVKATMPDGRVELGCGAVVKYRSGVFFLTALHVVRGSISIQAGKDGLWVDLPLTYRRISSDGAAWEVESTFFSRVGAKQATVMSPVHGTAASIVGRDGLGSGGALGRKAFDLLSFSGSTKPGFSGAPVMVGTKVAGIHVGETQGVNICWDVEYALEHYDDPHKQVNPESQTTSDMQDHVKTYYNKGQVKTQISDFQKKYKIPEREVGEEEDWGEYDQGAEVSDWTAHWTARFESLNQQLAESKANNKNLRTAFNKIALENVTLRKAIPAPVPQTSSIYPRVPSGETPPPEGVSPEWMYHGESMTTQSEQPGVDFRKTPGTTSKPRVVKSTKTPNGQFSVDLQNSLLYQASLNPSLVSQYSNLRCARLRKQLSNQGLVNRLKLSQITVNQLLDLSLRQPVSAPTKSTCENHPPPPNQ